MTDCIKIWKEGIEQGWDISKSEDKLQIGTHLFDLNTENVFKTHNLNTIYFYWVHRDDSVTEYIKLCEDSHIPVVPFVDRSELMDILTTTVDGGEKESPISASSASTAHAETTTKRKAEDDVLINQIKANEIDLIDHNKALRGSKLIDFSQIKRECEIKIIKPILSSKKSKTSSSGTTSANSGLSVTLKNKEPIILMSPSASALLNMSNIKEFLSSGKFDSTPGSTTLNSDNVIKIKHVSDKFSKSINFLIINNIDKFIVKPEYWDRVVAIFTTGQEWQFKNYKFKEPNVLFQRFKGFYVGWEGDPVPENINKWNVEVIKMERNVRFKDGQVSQHLWESLERWMSVKGYK